MLVLGFSAMTAPLSDVLVTPLAQVRAKFAEKTLNLVALAHSFVETAVRAQAGALQAAQAANANMILDVHQDVGGHTPGLQQNEGAAQRSSE